MALAFSPRRALGGLLAALAFLAGGTAAHAAEVGGAPAGAPPSTGSTTPPSPGADPFLGNGLWIWNIARSERGDPAAIGARARTTGLSHVVVKAADGTTPWKGFTAPFLTALHGQGLRVCGYQRVKSAAPIRQARLFAAQIRLGADCAVIDAESELEGRYPAATAYMATLRAALGSRFPIALTSFPWVGYHPQFPYSVFLGKGGAQFNLPQIYWKDIGVGVDRAFANTYPANSVYNRPIRPIGQLYDAPPARDITRFRALAGAYGSGGMSWWVWESASPAGWAALAAPIPMPPVHMIVTPPTLAVGARGDLVRWARIRLAARRAAVRVGSDRFDTRMRSAVQAYQAAHGLPVTGAVDPATWALLKPRYRLSPGY